MLKTGMILGLVIFWGYALAEDKPKELKLPDFSKIDQEMQKKKKKRVKYSVNCTDPRTGKTVSQGDPDFANCAAQSGSRNEHGRDMLFKTKDD